MPGWKCWRRIADREPPPARGLRRTVRRVADAGPDAGGRPPAPPPYSLWDWWQDGQRTGNELWGGLVVNYDAEEQADLWSEPAIAPAC